MQYKLIALDLDGTLLNKDHKLARGNINIIKRIQASGVKVIIATGRMLVSAMPFIKELDLSGPMITYNGGYVKDISTDELIYQNPIKLELAREVLKISADNSLHANLYLDDQLFVARRDERTRIYEKVSGIKALEVGQLVDFIEKDPSKILIIEPDMKKHEYYLNFFQKKFSPILTVTRSMDSFIEIMAGGVNKGKALAILAERLGIKKSETIAIGDSWNDLEMLTWAGLGITMEHSSEEIKKRVDMVAPSHNDEGVARILEKIFDL